jgi:hypothetical protein
VPQPGGERGHHGLGVVPGPVEPPVDHPLHAVAQRVEQGRGDQRAGRDGHRRPDRQHVRGQQHQAAVHAHQQGRDQRVGHDPADDPVELVQPVLQHRHAQARRQRAERHDQKHPDHRTRAPPGHLAHGQRNEKHAEDQRDQADAAAAVQPLELLAALAVRTPVGRELAAQPDQPAQQGRRDDRAVEHQEHAGRLVGEVAAGGEVDVAARRDQHPGHRSGHGERDAGREQDRGRTPPPAAR